MQMIKLTEKFEEMRKNAESLETYVKLDHFKAKQYEGDLKLNNARIRWCGPDTYTVNDRAEALRPVFSDPSRMPHYDQEGGYWDLSKKFDIEQNESKEQKEKSYVHPFMRQYI